MFKKMSIDLVVLTDQATTNLKVAKPQVGHVQPEIDDANLRIYAPNEKEACSVRVSVV